MPKYRVIAPLSGLINGHPWPSVGGVVELDAHLSMPELAVADEVIEERRPAPTAGAEKRPARKRVAKP